MNFPAASAGWRISEESFMDGTKNWLDNLKLRVGWGITGSAKIDPYSSVFLLVESSNMLLGGVPNLLTAIHSLLHIPDFSAGKNPTKRILV
jgi:hypothetical protein